MSGNYLLDTSVMVVLLKPNSELDKKLAEAHKLYISTVALGELYYGIERSLQKAKNITDLDKLLQRINVLSVDVATARLYAFIKRGQEKKGLILPENDLWIAATAVQYNLPLATRDHHFNWIVELAVEQW